MEEFIKAMAQMRDEMRELKELLFNHLKLTRAKLFKELWLDGPEVCAILHISSRKLRTLRIKGKLPYSMIEGKQYFRLSDINKLLKRNYSNNQSIQKS